MSDSDEAFRVLTEQMQALQEAMTRQQQTITQQEAALAALQTQVLDAERTRDAETAGTRTPQVHKTSRRRLLTTAGAAAAAATTAAVVLGASNAPVAHAASGDFLVLGQGNDAGSETQLYPSSTSSPDTLLSLDNPSGTALDSRGGVGDIGVYGESAGTVIGGSLYGIGVSGYSDSGFGVLGSSSTGYAVLGQSTLGPDLASYGTGLIFQLPQSTAGAPTAGTYDQGTSQIDANGDLWICIDGDGSGIGTWARVTHVLSGSIGGAITYLSKPVRLLDTRSGASDALHNGGGPYSASGSPYPLTIAGASFSGVTIPAGALGAIGNVTVVTGSITGGGYVALVPHGSGTPGTSTVNYTGGGQVVANGFNVGLSSGEIDIYVGNNNATDVIIDIFAVIS